MSGSTETGKALNTQALNGKVILLPNAVNTAATTASRFDSQELVLVSTDMDL